MIGNLDSKNFAEREAAEAELIKLAQKAGDAVRSAARTTTSPEVRSRVNKILEGLQPQAECSPEEALELRAVWTLELAGAPEARKLLREWAESKSGTRLSEEAMAALERIEWKSSRVP